MEAKRNHGSHPKPSQSCRHPVPSVPWSNADQRRRCKPRSQIFPAGSRTAQLPWIPCHHVYKQDTGWEPRCNKAELLEQLLDHHHSARFTRPLSATPVLVSGRWKMRLGWARLAFALLPWHGGRGISLPQWVKRVFRSCSPPISDPEAFWEAQPSASSARQQGKLVVIPRLVLTLMNNKTLKATGWYSIKLYPPSLKHS